jgi:hypothetical protein
MIYMMPVMFFFMIATTNAAVSTGRTINVLVELTDCGATVPDKVGIVIDGDEGGELPLTSHDGGHYWYGQWTDHRRKKFPYAKLSASLRFSNGRSYCQIASADKGAQEVPVAIFKFKCDAAPVRHVTIDTRPQSLFSYTRRLTKSMDRNDNDCECNEVGAAKSGVREVRDVRFPVETVALRVRNETAQAQTYDLSLLDPNGDPEAAAPMPFDPIVRRNAKILPSQDARCKVDALCMSREGIVTALGQQRAPRSIFSSPAYDLDYLSLAKLELLILKVK